jgi:hypothetical protein
MLGHDGKAFLIHELGYTGPENLLFFGQQGINLVEVHGSSPIFGPLLRGR